MDRHPSDPQFARLRPLLRTADQGTVACLVVACFLAMLLHGCWLITFRHQRIDFDRAPPLQVDFQINVNTADWPEFMLLPDIGETLARRIVTHRDQHGPFRSVDQLADVHGIGPKTLRRIRPLLRVE